MNTLARYLLTCSPAHPPPSTPPHPPSRTSCPPCRRTSGPPQSRRIQRAWSRTAQSKQGKLSQVLKRVLALYLIRSTFSLDLLDTFLNVFSVTFSSGDWSAVSEIEQKSLRRHNNE